MILKLDEQNFVVENDVYFTDDFELFSKIVSTAKKWSITKNCFESQKIVNQKKPVDVFLKKKSQKLTVKIICINDQNGFLISDQNAVSKLSCHFDCPIIIFNDCKKTKFPSFIKQFQLTQYTNEVIAAEKRHLSVKFNNKILSVPKIKTKSIWMLLLTILLGCFGNTCFYFSGFFDISTQIDSTYQYIGKRAYESDNNYSHAEYIPNIPLSILGEGGANEIMNLASGYNSFTPYYYVSTSNFRDTKYVPFYIRAYSRDLSDIKITFANGKTKNITLISSGTDLGYASPTNDESISTYNVFSKIALKRKFYLPNDFRDNNSKTLFLTTSLIEEIKNEDEVIEDYIANPEQHVILTIGENEYEYSIANLLVDDYGHTPVFKTFLGDFAYLNLSFLNESLYANMCFDSSSSYINTQTLVNSSLLPYFQEGDCFIGYSYVQGLKTEISEFTELSNLYTISLFGKESNWGNIAKYLFVFAGIILEIIFTLLIYKCSKSLDSSWKYSPLFFNLLLGLLILTPPIFVSVCLNIYQVTNSFNFSSYKILNSFGGLFCLISFLCIFAVLFLPKIVKKLLKRREKSHETLHE